MQKFVSRVMPPLGFAVVAWVAALAPNSANAATVPALTITGGTASGTALIGPDNFGWSFTVSELIQIEGLGVYDHNLDGLLSSHRVRLWDGLGGFLGSVLVPSGSGGTLVDQFRYVLFSGTFPLNPGTYFITATYSAGDGDNFLVLATGLATDPRISYLGAAFSPGVLSPSLTGQNDRFFGPNFLLSSDLREVPLPTALPLFATGLGVLGLLGWRRKRKVAA